MATNSNPDITLYYHPDSFYSQKVIMYLFERKIPFRAKYVNINRGHQFTSEFLAMSPRGEVPVLVDQNTRTIPDSQKIIEYLEDNFYSGVPKLIPSDVEFKSRCEELNRALHSLRIEALTLGSCMYQPRDLQINPKKPYNTPRYRKQVQDMVRRRLTNLRDQIKKFPMHGAALSHKLSDVEAEMALIYERQTFESLIIQFESLLDECEAELMTHDDSNFWLVAPSITVADISLGILMHRLWQLGYEQRMWLKHRPLLAAYYNNRICSLMSFQKAKSLSPESPLAEMFSSPICLGTISLVGIAAIAAGLYYVWKYKDFRAYNFLDIILGRKSIPAMPARVANPQLQATRYY